MSLNQGHRNEQLFDLVLRLADPVPSEQEWVTGIAHRNNAARNRDVKFDPVRALTSKQMHYFTMLQEALPEEISQTRERQVWCLLGRPPSSGL